MRECEGPIVSVIMPVYNSEKYLAEAVNSVCRQTVHNIQIILIDDFSEDRSFECCKKLALKDQRVEVHRHDKNRGVSATRNSGLSYATGKYILFMDSDDKIDDNMLELLISLIEENPHTDLAVCGYYIDDKPQIRRGEKKRKMGRLEAAKAAAGKNGSLMKGYVVNKLFKRDVIVRENLKFDENIYICEDLLFCQQYIWNCRYIYYTPEPKYHYITRAGSAMHGRVTENRMSVLNTFSAVIQMGRKYDNTELDSLLNASYWNHYVSILKDVVKHPSMEQKKYGDIVFPYIKMIVFKFLRSKHVTFKRKVLIILLRIGYPFWRALPVSSR